MLQSIALIVLAGLLSGWLCKKIHFPGLFGMIAAGILIGPHVLNLIDASILAVSSDIRRIALIVILIRAGLKLNLGDLKKVGRPAVLMCFVPACCEILGTVLLAPGLLGISRLEAAILGAVIAAVSPAVVVPRMIRLLDEGYGVEKGIPQMILSGASVDDVFVIVLFTTFTGLAQGGRISVMRFAHIPLSIASGIAIGLLVGTFLVKWFDRSVIPDTVKLLLLLSVSFLFSAFEDAHAAIPFASLIAVMCIGAAIRRARPGQAKRLSSQYDKLWIVAEIFLFVLVGASVAIASALSAGPGMLLLLFGALIFRCLGVFVCLLGTALTLREKCFCMIAYIPKATVQAAIGGLPLAMGLPCGQLVLTVSVLAILITAPLGALGIDLTYRRLPAGRTPE